MMQYTSDLHKTRESQITAHIQEWLLAKLSEWLAIDREDIEIDQPFASYGLSSINAMYLIGELEDHLNYELSPTLAYEYPTVETFAQHVARLVSEAS